MTTSKIPTLTTDRLRLRAFRADDLDAYAAMRANPEVIRYLGPAARPPQPRFGA
jgi:RimJ/RimL family protein N-acetyltransferase